MEPRDLINLKNKIKELSIDQILSIIKIWLKKNNLSVKKSDKLDLD